MLSKSGVSSRHTEVLVRTHVARVPPIGKPSLGKQLIDCRRRPSTTEARGRAADSTYRLGERRPILDEYIFFERPATVRAPGWNVAGLLSNPAYGVEAAQCFACNEFSGGGVTKWSLGLPTRQPTQPQIVLQNTVKVACTFSPLSRVSPVAFRRDRHECVSSQHQHCLTEL